MDVPAPSPSYKTPQEQRFERVEAAFDLPMLVFTFVLLLIVISEAMLDISGGVLTYFRIADAIIWVAFVVELVTLTYLSPDRVHYLISRWYNVLIVLVPFLRILRLSRIAYLIELERSGSAIAEASRLIFGSDVLVLRVFALLSKSAADIRTFIVENKIGYVASALGLAIVVLGAIVTFFERVDPSANITTIHDGIWWSLVSITAVGYGDYFPVTLGGRVIGVILITMGITLFSLFTANLASFIMGNKEEADTKIILKRVGALEEKIDLLLEEKKKQ